ncbi:MAG: tautomerase family protein [Pseudonocardia sp.]|uniref:tautomerase family protein n=1 Tax=unclassified Pseudonocardia TaxID=2619320 RepID=UPI00086F932F|nr:MULTISPECIES: tautomerase family protein [unclassified Pseudonocardia]MBN9107493.1 tautomerase family protein [Pseudonocardia sp.]ODU18100.1 MAG: 4-oxalocrotonate tautomerase [Pseudonocardia sp. SCN 72-51]ODV08351.1 MAG: 4-oxalocrotonate tautomerase [Pseudonocardia sp. SCN 73-27]
MPIFEVHLVAGRHPPERLAELLRALSARYAEILESPVERVRGFVTAHPAAHVVAGGEVGVEAPYVTALVLRGRPVEQRHRLIAAFTDVVVDVLGAARASVRVRIEQVDPDEWGIAGVPASAARATEIAARAAGSG